MLRKYTLALSMLALAVALSGCGEAGPGASYSPSDSALPPVDASPDAPVSAVDSTASPSEAGLGQGPGQGGDRFDPIMEEGFLAVQDAPFSTFSIDVDTASYAKARQYLMQYGTLPPADAVRIEELVNYFDYDYPPPTDSHPFSVNAETADCPWRSEHRLLRIAVQGREMDTDPQPKNLVFLIDVSGSMNAGNKLPLVKEGLQMLVQRLDHSDRVAIVVYAGAAGMVLPPTPVSEHRTISTALNRLHAGGSTNGGEGIQLAYRAALDNFVEGGVNRVVLCTDGDFNVGVTSTGDLVRLAERNARAGVFLSVLGFGIGNHNDAMLEQISNKANGNYAFIDTPAEARKVLVEQLSGTLVTIAKDVKIQVEFNPAHIAAYRLIGYENRRLADRDFNDDRKDAGEIGAGHSVTALYEVVPPGRPGGEATPLVDPLKYQSRTTVDTVDHGELLTVKLRYKLPDQAESTRLDVPIAASERRFTQASVDFRFAAAVALFGMVLRDSPHRRDAGCQTVYQIADSARGSDRHGYRAEFLEMVRRAASLVGEDIGAVEQAAGTLPTSVHPRPGSQPFTPPSAFALGGGRTALAIGLGIVVGILVSTIAAAIGLHLAAKASRPQETRRESVKTASVPQNVENPRARPAASRWPTDGVPAAAGPKGL